jgi:hypothetical protein
MSAVGAFAQRSIAVRWPANLNEICLAGRLANLGLFVLLYLQATRW